MHRLAEMEEQAVLFYNAFVQEYNDCADYLAINFVNINIAVSRYFNDLIRLRTMHNITLLHRTKIAAYTAKWVWLNPIMCSNACFEEFLKLDGKSKWALSNSNFLFISDLVRYFMPHDIDYLSEEYNPIIEKFLYTMKIGAYEEHLACALLETISPVIEEDGVAY